MRFVQFLMCASKTQDFFEKVRFLHVKKQKIAFF